MSAGRQLLRAAVLAAWASVALAEAPPSAPAATDPRLAQATAAVDDLGKRLRTALVAQLQAAGPVGAVDFCEQQAPAIAEAVGADHGVSVGRTSLRVRNPDNRPNAWQRGVLDDFARSVAAGAEPQRLEYADSAARFRYARGIRVEGPCLACHGSLLPAAVDAAIRERYPQDAATGYAEGELRGMFWVEIAEPQPAEPQPADPRAAIPMRPAQAAALRAEMRDRLETQQRLLAALAAGDWEGAAEAADAGTRGRHAGADFRSALPRQWFSFARPLHQAFAAARDEARGERRLDVALGHVARAGAFCTGCHASFRTSTAADPLARIAE